MTAPTTSEHLDVVIVGAGLSGIGAGSQLEMKCPGKTYAVLEARNDIGGTWDLFRYPGIRSDSDMFTLGYAFRPWTDPKAIADGPSILRYVRDTAREHRVDEKVRFGHRVVRAEWSSADARWTLEIERGEERETTFLTCGFLFMCSGYYRYDEPYTPEFTGTERFRGTIVHPQHWTDDIDYAGKRVVVIGSGATAVTLVPAMAETAAHVTMLQRSPSYVASLPAEDPLANLVRRLLPTKLAYSVVRWKNVFITMGFFNLSRRRPNVIRGHAAQGGGATAAGRVRRGHPLQPPLQPVGPAHVPRPGRRSLQGAEQRAGLGGHRPHRDLHGDRHQAHVGGGARGRRGGHGHGAEPARARRSPDRGGRSRGEDAGHRDLQGPDAGRACPISPSPSGYTNASWTLKCDLTCDWVCRLLNHMEERGYAQCVPEFGDAEVVPEPMIDFSSGYVQRSIHLFPKQGAKVPWRLHQNYPRDVRMLRYGAIEDEALRVHQGPPGGGRPGPA